MPKCTNCGCDRQFKSEPQNFTIHRVFLPKTKTAKRAKLTDLYLVVCPSCCAVETHHKSEGFLGYYQALHDDLWSRKLRENQEFSEEQAKKLYWRAYKEVMPLSRFMGDFRYQKRKLSKRKGQRVPEPNPHQNRLWS